MSPRRILIISTIQPSPEQVEQMVQSLEKAKMPRNTKRWCTATTSTLTQQCVAQITLIALKYDETNFLEELQRKPPRSPSPQDGEENQKKRNRWNRKENRPNSANSADYGGGKQEQQLLLLGRC